MTKSKTTSASTDLVLVGPPDPRVIAMLSGVFTPQPATEADGDTIDPKTMLTPNQREGLRTRFVGEFCDTVETNSRVMQEYMQRVQAATAVLRETIGGDGRKPIRQQVKKDNNPAAAQKPVQSYSARLAKMGLPREGTKERALLDFIRDEGKVPRLQMIEWACSSKKINPDGESQEVVMHRLGVMLPTLKAKGWITPIKGESGRPIYWQYVGKTKTSPTNSEPQQKSAHVGHSHGPKPGTHKATVLDIIAAAGPEGTTAAEIRQRYPGLKNLNSTIRGLKEGNHVRNTATAGRGNKARYVATMVNAVNNIRQATARAIKDSKTARGETKPEKTADGEDGDRAAHSRLSIDDDDKPRDADPKPRWRPPPSRDKEILPQRPTPLPKKALVTKNPRSAEDWDNLVLRLEEDWHWLLTFEWLVKVAKTEGPFYGFSIDTWGSSQIRNEMAKSVKRLEYRNKLRISEDGNTLLPFPNVSANKRPAGPAASPKEPKLQKKPSIPNEERPEINSPNKWSEAVLSVIEQADSSITESEIADLIWANDLNDWRRPENITPDDVAAGVRAAILYLRKKLLIDIVTDIEVDDQGQRHWKIA